jgi:hypothetical protein
MLFQNLNTSELENLLIEETKKYTSYLRGHNVPEEREQIRLRIEVLIKALSERKESSDRIHEIIQKIDNKERNVRSSSDRKPNSTS